MTDHNTEKSDEQTCPRCGGELQKSEPECRGHCTGCEQRGQ